MGYIKLGVIDVVEEHINSAEVVSREVYLLTKKAKPDIFFAKNLGGLKKQGTGTAGRVLNLIHFGLADDRNAA